MKQKILLLIFLCFPFALVAQNTGVGTSNPLEFFSVGASSQFRVNASGNIVRINDVAYSFPASQATTGSILANDGSGNLTWTKVTAGNISATGTPSSSTYLRGDGAWASAGGGSGVTQVTSVTVSSFSTVATTTLGPGQEFFSYSASQSGTYLITGFLYTSSPIPDTHVFIKINGTIVWATNVANGFDNYGAIGFSTLLFLPIGTEIITVTAADYNGATYAGGSVRLVKL